MVIDLNEVTSGSLHVEQSFDVVAIFESYSEIEQLDQADLAMVVSSAGALEYSVRGSLRAAGRARCARCLEPFPVTFSGKFDLRYRPESARPAPGDDEEEAVAYYRDTELPVLPLLEEQINLMFPMRFLCAESCRGLCPQCGANRNENPCTCESPTGGSPFGALKQLLD